MFEALSFLFLGLFVGLCGGYFGIGGGLVGIPLLYSIFASMGLENPLHVAIGTSVTSLVGSTTLSFISHSRLTTMYPFTYKVLFPGAFFGALTGALSSTDIPESFLKLLLACFEILAGLRILLHRASEKGFVTPKTGIVLPAGFGIGFFSSLLGLGGGVLTVPFLSSLGMPHKKAVGNASLVSCAIITTTAIAHFIATYGYTDEAKTVFAEIYLPGFPTLFLGAASGAFCGAKLVHKTPSDISKRAFAILLLIAGGTLFVKSLSL